MNTNTNTFLENPIPTPNPTSFAAPARTLTGLVPDGSLGHDEVCLANESRFNESYFSEPLTVYAAGWRDPNRLEETLNFVAPRVMTTRRFEYAEFANKEEFYSEGDDARAIGGAFKLVEYTARKANAKTENRGLTIRVDLDEVADKANWRENYTGKLLRRLLRNELRRAVALLAAAATNTAKTWDTTAGKDPDKDVETDLIAAADESGVRPNRILYGDTAWDRRRLAFRAQNNAGGYASAGLTSDQLRSSG